MPKGLEFEIIDGVRQQPEGIKRILEEAEKTPIHYTRDAPRLTPKQLAKFKPRSAERLAKYGLPPNPEVQKIIKQKETSNKNHR